MFIAHSSRRRRRNNDDNYRGPKRKKKKKKKEKRTRKTAEGLGRLESIPAIPHYPAAQLCGGFRKTSHAVVVLHVGHPAMSICVVLEFITATEG